MKEIKVDFASLESDVTQDYEQRNKNYIQVEIQLPDGQVTLDPSYCVTIKMSRDAMVGLAKNLLKEAYAPDSARNELRLWEFVPALPRGITQVLGVSMYPHSCELKIFEEDDGPLRELLQQSSI